MTELTKKAKLSYTFMRKAEDTRTITVMSSGWPDKVWVIQEDGAYETHRAELITREKFRENYPFIDLDELKSLSEIQRENPNYYSLGAITSQL